MQVSFLKFKGHTDYKLLRQSFRVHLFEKIFLAGDLFVVLLGLKNYHIKEKF